MGQAAHKHIHGGEILGPSERAWTPSSRAYLEQALRVLRDMEEFWPLTLRGVFYQLVKDNIIRNCRPQYQKLSVALSDARIDGLVPWEALEDRSRPSLWSGAWLNQEVFVREQVDGFLEGYRRDLLQTQDIRPEVWIEKDTLAPYCHRGAFPYCVHVIVAKGFASTSFVKSCQERILRAKEQGQHTAILYFGDLDPSGWFMLPAMEEKLRGPLGIGPGVFSTHRVALTGEQVEAMGLPRSLDALKEGDPRTPAYREMFGELAVELDAIHPRDMGPLTTAAIENVIDVDTFRREQARQQEERDGLQELRATVDAAIAEYQAGFSGDDNDPSRPDLKLV